MSTAARSAATGPARDALLAVRARVGGDRPRLDIDVTVTTPGVLGVVGPNGAGKTTLLRTIAGLEAAASSSRLTIDGQDVTDSGPSERRVAYVPQSGALFPHLSVRDNVAYGIRASGTTRSEARHRASDQLALLGLGELADRRPSTLSGGQRQRVAIARALAVNPKVILLDEPTASLDAAGRAEVRSVLRHQLSTFPGVTVLVTHDASEVLTVASRVLVIEEGEVVQDDTATELVRRPGSPWLAEMLRINAWPGVVADPSMVELDDGGRLSAIDLPPSGTPVIVTASPAAVALFPGEPTGSARNSWRAVVEDVVVLGDRIRVVLTAAGEGPRRTVAEITRQAADELGVRPGSSHFAALKATELTVSPL